MALNREVNKFIGASRVNGLLEPRGLMVYWSLTVFIG